MKLCDAARAVRLRASYRRREDADKERVLVVYFCRENLMSEIGIENPGRRSFLRAAPVAAAAGLALADASLFAAPIAGGAAPMGERAKYQVFTAEQIEKDIETAKGDPANVNLVEEKGVSFTMVLTKEENKSAPEFESHEARDHIFHILEGSTTYEVGGTPKGGHMIGPGEWRGPESVGATKITLNKGDRLIVPRGTPHKRSTAGSVTFTLISPEGVVKS
jgi:quercetin dioxygenase-like cupin family protein